MITKKTENPKTAETPLILCLETSGRFGSAAIAQGPEFLEQINFSAPMRHSREIFPAINQLLNKLNKTSQEIDHIYISSGPGSFTGLRISSTIAKIMDIAKEIKIAAVNTLDVIARNVQLHSENIAVVLDAKRGKFFVAGYKNSNGNWLKTTEDLLLSAEEFHELFDTKNKPASILGEGLVYYKKVFSGEKVTLLDEKDWYPQAEKVYELGWEKAKAYEFSDAATLKPTYLRRPV